MKSIKNMLHNRILWPVLGLLTAAAVLIWKYESEGAMVKGDHIEGQLEALMERPDWETLEFWEQKLADQPEVSIYKQQLASQLAGRFRAEGRIEDLLRSNNLLKSALKTEYLSPESVYLQMSTNAITGHEFKEALRFADKALELRPEWMSAELVRFDALLELGRIKEAHQIMYPYREDGRFDILVRQAKLRHAQGDHHGGMRAVQEAYQWTRKAGLTDMQCWSMNTLADMYAHHGQIREAYECYLKALDAKPGDRYALKGIAWIALAKDGNPEIAEKIADAMQSRFPHPDIHLLQAEIADFRGETNLGKGERDLFVSMTRDPRYGRMYDRHLIALSFELPALRLMREKLIQRELENRPDPVTWSLKALHHADNGELKQAVNIASAHVAGKTHEPDALWRLARVYLADGDHELADKYLHQASHGAFELGPTATKEIERTLATLEQ